MLDDSLSFTACKKPETHRDLRRVKELAGERDHAVHEVSFDDGFPYLALPRLIGGHAAIGEDESGHASGCEVMDEMLHPGVVGVAGGRRAEFPAHVVPQSVAAPVAHVEG